MTSDQPLGASDRNEHGQPVGVSLAGWTARPLPPRRQMLGQHCRLEPLDPPRHAPGLHAAFAAEGEPGGWTYMAYGPFADAPAYETWCATQAGRDDPQFYAILVPGAGPDPEAAPEADWQPAGVASFMRIVPATGVIEIGHIRLSGLLRQSTAATEALFLMLQRVFDTLGYRRCEWKCDALNAPSRRAALRLGFSFEGVFRQATVVKGRNRDTAWFAMTDADWQRVRPVLAGWIAETGAGVQTRPLSAAMDLALGRR